MSILADWQIEDHCRNTGMIEPFFPRQVREVGARADRVISYGLSSHGYDVRLGSDIKIFSNLAASLTDPKAFVADQTLTTAVVHFDGNAKYFVLPAHSYALGCTMETFKIPRNLMVVCVGKSTYARCGIHVNVTPIEAGFQGQVVIEISNATPLPARIYIHEGIAQFLFFQGENCDISYADRAGKYQGQSGVTLPKA